MSILTIQEIESIVKSLLTKYGAEYALLFGSYARGEATPESDTIWLRLCSRSAGS